MNVAWALGLPLFSILYRVQNYWNVPRVTQFLSRPGDARLAAINAIALAAFYAGMLVWAPLVVLKAVWSAGHGVL